MNTPSSDLPESSLPQEPSTASAPHNMSWKEKINALEQLMRLDKPIGIALLLWPTLFALWSASYRKPEASLVLLIVVGTIVMRSAGCVLNDLADRHFDGHVWRTKNRPLVTNAVSVGEAWALALVLLLTALLIVIKLNDPTVYGLAIFGAVITLIYPLCKRFMSAPQAVLGIAFSLGIPMCFALLHRNIPSLMWWLLGLNVVYVVAYDTVYAMADREDDRALGLKSTALLFGRYAPYMAMALYAVYAIGMLALLIHYGWHQWLFALVVAVVAFLVAQALLLQKNEPASFFKAFRQSHWLALIFWLSLLQWPLVNLRLF